MYDYCLEENWISSNNIISMLSTWRQNKSIIHGDSTSFTWKHLLAATNQLLIPDAEEQAQVYFFSLWGPLPRGSLCNWQSSCPAVWLGAHLHTSAHSDPRSHPVARPVPVDLAAMRAQPCSWGSHSCLSFPELMVAIGHTRYPQGPSYSWSRSR